MDKMDQWRDGLLSNAEIMNWLLNYMAEVTASIYADETKAADERMVRLGLQPQRTA